MSKVRKNISIEKKIEKTIKAIAKADRRTESAVVELAVEEYAAKRQVSNS